MSVDRQFSPRCRCFTLRYVNQGCAGKASLFLVDQLWSKTKYAFFSLQFFDKLMFCFWIFFLLLFSQMTQSWQGLFSEMLLADASVVKEAAKGSQPRSAPQQRSPPHPGLPHPARFNTRQLQENSLQHHPTAP